MTIMDDVSVQWPECTPLFDTKYIYGYNGYQYSFGYSINWHFEFMDDFIIRLTMPDR